ncbi:MAG TPA: alkaline phosphatase D family protein [Nevskiaceae bacterium]|nr:alkaline phosphatase D family protein [Nevskiaceae bacterium]
MDRRDFLHRLLLLSGGGLTPLLSGCGNSAPAAAGGGRFLHGVASGDPLAEAVIVWTRITPDDPAQPVAVALELSDRPDFSAPLRRLSALTDASRDHTVKLDLRDLSPDTRYWYRFRSGDQVSPVGRTRTAPQAAVERLDFAVVTCSDYTRGLYNAYARVAEAEDLQAVIHLGDYIYEGGRTDRLRPHDPPRECLGLADYRRRYASYRETAELQAVHAAHPMIWVWDDHESCDGAWIGGADNHDESEDGPWALRKAAAIQAAFEWLPIRPPDPAQPARIHRAFSFGPLCDLTMLDTRLIGRDQPLEPNLEQGFSQTGAFADPARELLGAEQQDWAVASLASRAPVWRLLGNQVVMAPLKILGAPRALGGGVYANPDQWDGYEPARDRFLDALQGLGLRNLVVLTGDVHASMAFDLVRDPNNPAAYEPLSGAGSEGVELVTPSISSAGENEEPAADPEQLVEQLIVRGSEALRASNPHLKLFDASRNGWLRLRLSVSALRAEFWLVPTVRSETAEQTLAYAFDVAEGSQRLVEDVSVRAGL